MKGPAPQPTRLKILQGNPGKKKLNTLEPILEAGIPAKPKGLDRFESREWNRIMKALGPARVLTKGDAGTLLVAVSAYSQLKRCKAVCAKGFSYETTSRSGTVLRRLHPEASLLNTATHQYSQALAELGLTPSSRSRVKVLPAQEPASGIEEYFN